MIRKQKRLLADAEGRVLSSYVAASAAGGPALRDVLAESVYCELRRLQTQDASREKQNDLAFWHMVRTQLHKGSDAAMRHLLSRAIHRYAVEVCGNMNMRIYQLMSRMAPPALGLLLNAWSPKKLLTQSWQHGALDDTIILQGETEHLRRLQGIGTIILAPTHVSNLDSVVLAFAAYRLGLPPFVYGAGLNLFGNPLLALFMHNLGAYTVDRRKQDPLYKNVLKTYATATLRAGDSNLFFPGGTRSRSGALEHHLKLGLLGTGLAAYTQNIQEQRPRPSIFIVPTTLSFQLVLEAETLIDDFLKDVGKSRYIISDDEFAEPSRIYDFLSQLMALESKIYITVGQPMDPFGNRVDDAGVSLDPHGRRVDARRFVMVQGKVCADPQRDAEYTREVGARLLTAYAQDNVLQSTHAVAYVVLALLRRANPDLEQMRLLRAGGRVEHFALTEVYRATEVLLTALRGLQRAGRVRLAPALAFGRADDVVADATSHFATYHRPPVMVRQGDVLHVRQRSLLFYYHNRLTGYGLEHVLDVPVLRKVG